MPIDKAVPAGLIVNELVTNSFKYAFGEAGGASRCASRSTKIGEACIEVADDGRGMASRRRRARAHPRQGLRGPALRAVEPTPVKRGTCTRVFFPLAS